MKCIRSVARCTAFVATFTLACQARAQGLPMLSDLTPKTAAADVKVPVYDVASVKPNKGEGNMIAIRNTPDGFSATNLPLKFLLSMAYGIRQDLISGGPDWVNSARFDVDAKVAGDDVETLKKLNGEQRRSMLVPVLAERFQLKAHTETKIAPVYELSIAKGGIRFKEAAPLPAPSKDAPPPQVPKAAFGSGAPPKGGAYISMGPGMFSGHGMTVSALANQLAQVLRRTVVDKTGLTGRYDFELKWTPDDMQQQQHTDSGGADSGPSIFTAVQEQLGLKLDSAKGPVEALVIDHAEKPVED